MARVTPQQASAKWQQRLQAASQQITDGVNGVTVAPGVSAAAQSALWLSQVTASQAKWKANVAAVSLQQWQAQMINVGIPRISQGATNNVAKVTAFFTNFLPFLDQGVAKVKAMPKGGINNSIARATAMIQWNAGYKAPIG